MDVAQDVIVREEDCGTKEFIEMPLLAEDGKPNENLLGRYTAKEVKTKRGRSLAKKDVLLDKESLVEVVEGLSPDAESDTVPVRSVLKCEAQHRHLPALLRRGSGHRQAGGDRRRGGHHRRPVDR